MTAKRILLGAVAAVCVAGSAWGQSPPEGVAPPLPASPFPPVAGDGLLPATAQEKDPAPKSAVYPEQPLPPATSLLTTTPGQQPVHPPGTVTSPWCGPGGTGCCGPIGGNGPVDYDLYAMTGPSLPVAGGGFKGRLLVGWEVNTGIRTLFFNPQGSAAWVLDTGVSYTYNRGKQQDTPLQVFARQPSTNGVPNGPDQLVVFGIRGLNRTNVNVAIGRDWFTRGPGFTGTDCRVNWRYGGDVGFRWGTAHVDLVPQADLGNYTRRSGITDSIFFGFHADREVNMGSWIFLTGARAEYDYTWSNLIPDQNGDLISVNLMLYTGVRF